MSTVKVRLNRKRDHRFTTAHKRQKGSQLRDKIKRCNECGDCPWRRAGVCPGCERHYSPEKVER